MQATAKLRPGLTQRLADLPKGHESRCKSSDARSVGPPSIHLSTAVAVIVAVVVIAAVLSSSLLLRTLPSVVVVMLFCGDLLRRLLWHAGDDGSGRFKYNVCPTLPRI